VQDAMFDPLRQRLLQAECSGAFVLLNTTINSSIPDAQLSRSGIYLQPCDFQWVDADVLLYRGVAEVGKRHGAMTHRKWRQEFNTDEFMDYAAIMDSAALPLETAYRISDLITLPGTSERAMLLSVPMIGADGTVYGICGFEINESYFKLHHSQASNLKHLTCLMATEQDGVIYATSGLSAGITNGYYFAPKYDLTVSDLRNGLLRFSADPVSHVGVMRQISFYEGDPGFVAAGRGIVNCRNAVDLCSHVHHFRFCFRRNRHFHGRLHRYGFHRWLFPASGKECNDHNKEYNSSVSHPFSSLQTLTSYIT